MNNRNFFIEKVVSNYTPESTSKYHKSIELNKKP